MKRTVHILILPAVLLMAHVAVAWDWYPLGGGNAEKIVVVDDPDDDVDGAWFFDKDGGAFWINWTGSSPDYWGYWKCFDPQYSWHMGGDVFDIGGTFYALNVTMHGHHYYQQNGSNWEYSDEAANDYYYYHDAQFFEEDDGDRSYNYFLVSTWQWWEPSGSSYERGIYLIDDGEIIVDRIQVGGTDGKTYPKIYRDLEDAQLFYTWYGTEPTISTIQFQNFSVSGTAENNFSASDVANNFVETGYTLKDIGGFYQYAASNDRHQYLLAKTDYSGTLDWNVWYRHEESDVLNADGWSIVWPTVDGQIGCGAAPLTPCGLAAGDQTQTQKLVLLK
jgi:hypothetical protein